MTWDWTQLFRTIGGHSTHLANEPVFTKYNQQLLNQISSLLIYSYLLVGIYIYLTSSPLTECYSKSILSGVKLDWIQSFVSKNLNENYVYFAQRVGQEKRSYQFKE